MKTSYNDNLLSNFDLKKTYLESPNKTTLSVKNITLSELENLRTSSKPLSSSKHCLEKMIGFTGHTGSM